jgi:hypothetical protein
VNSAIARSGAAALAVTRLGIGLIAVARPDLAARAWLGRAATGDPATGELVTPVFGRALGGRDVALAVGALASARASESRALRRWLFAGAIADAADAMATLTRWRALPAGNRALVLAASGGGALTGCLIGAALR